MPKGKKTNKQEKREHPSPHDTKVKKIADKEKSEGKSVKADIPGYPKPTKRGTVIPDVELPKEIIEVETQKSMKTDKEQRRRLKISAKEKKQKFKVVEVKE